MKNHKNRLNPFLGTLAVIAMTQSAHAASATWNGTTDATWATGTNWSATPVPGTGDTATFNNAGNAKLVIDLGAGVTIGGILFDTSSVAAYTIGSGTVGSQTLTLDDGGTISGGAAVATNQLFNAKLTLGADATAQSYSITNNSATNSLTLAGAISGGTGGTAGVKTLNVSTVNQTGVITLSGAITNGGASGLALAFTAVSGISQSNLGNTANTYTGGTSIGNGVRLQVNGGTGKGFGTGDVTVASGGQAYVNSAGTYTNSFAIAGTGGTTGGSLGAIRIGAAGTNINADVTLNANSSVGVDSGRSGSITGSITGAFNLEKVSSGGGTGSPLTLSGINSYSGTTTITQGVISFAKQASLYNSNSANWIPAKITVASAAALALGVGDASSGYWDAAGVAAFLGGTQMGTSTTTAGFKSGSLLGFDTTNATGGTFTYGAIGNIGTSTNNGVLKLGAGTLVLNGTNTYTGVTNVDGGTLSLASSGAITGTTVAVGSGSTTIFNNSGGTATFSGALSLGTGTFSQSSGTSSVSSVSTSGSVDSGLVSISGGNFTATNDLSFGRTSFSTTGVPSLVTPLAAATTSGLYVNGASAAVSAATMNIGTANSNASARLDAGSLSVTGAVTVGKYSASSSRYSVLQVAGGTFTAVDTIKGVAIAANGGSSSNQTTNAEYYLTGGASTVGKISFGASTDTAGGTGFLILGGGTLYVGSGGIVKASTIGTYNYTLGITSGILGAAADWSSSLNMTLGTNPTIKAADSADVAHDITLSGVLSGTGFTKTGAGTLTLSGAANTYTGATSVTAGTLALVGGSQTSPITVSSGATLGFTLGSPTTSSSTLTFSGATAKVSVSGTPAAATLLTTTAPAGITGTPVLDPAIPGYTLAIEDGGTTLKLKAAAANNYNTWATTNGVPGQAANLDHDYDGVSNGIEYFIGGPNGNTTGFTPLPGVTTVAGVRSVTWTKAADYTGTYGTDYFVETSTTLDAGSWTTESSPGNVAISGNNVTYTFPAGPVKTFARLVVTGP